MSAATQAVQTITLTPAEIESLLKQLESCNLSDEARSVIQSIIESYVDLVIEVGNKKVNIARLKEILFGAPTETKANVMRRAGKTPGAGGEKEKKKKRPGHGRTSAKDYHGTTRVRIAHATLKPGDCCEDEDCSGKVYTWKARLIVRIHGTASFGGETHEQDRLRCSRCGKIFRAEVPPEVGEKKHDETVPSMAAVLRYGKGLPMNRIEELQKDFGVPLPASMHWTLMRDAAVLMEPAYHELIRQAAQGKILYNDDTPMRIPGGARLRVALYVRPNEPEKEGLVGGRLGTGEGSEQHGERETRKAERRSMTHEGTSHPPNVRQGERPGPRLGSSLGGSRKSWLT